MIHPIARTRSPGSRAEHLFAEDLTRVQRRCDRLFVWLMSVQWGSAVVLALALSPRTWEGRAASTHVHVWMALVLGGCISVPVVVLCRRRSGSAIARHAAAVGQMLWSTLLIHLTGGRIETHFHVFGSLAFLAFYRDWRVILTATILVAADHVVRGAFWPESVFGIADPEWWRVLEHVFWVLFEDAFLCMGIDQSLREMRTLAERQHGLEELHASLERKVVERTQALQQSQAQVRSLLESVHAVPLELDATRHAPSYMGPQAARLLQCEMEQWSSPSFWGRHVHDEDLPRLRAGFASCAAGAQHVEVEFRLRRDDAGWTWVRGIFSRANGETRIRGLLLDVTERRRLEDDLQQSQKLEAVGRLAAGVAHEINTPIQFVGDNVRFLGEAFGDVDRLLGAAGKVAAATDAATRAAAIEELAALQTTVDHAFLRAECPLAIRQSLEGVERVARIVQAMKDFAHADRSERGDVDLNRVIRSSITVCRNEWKYVADLEQDLDPADPIVRGHAHDLGQVVLNLVVNAAHAIAERTAADGTRGRIVVRSRIDGDRVVVAIRDDGAGIPETVRARVFEPFFTTKPVGKGSGLGLALCRRVVTERHGGSITFESEVGKGTVFRIDLPCAGVAAAPAPTA